MFNYFRSRISIRRGAGHPTWGATWLDLGRLRLIWCAPGHPNAWMIIWRRKLPEWNPGQWERRYQLTPEGIAAARAKDERFATEARQTAKAEAAARLKQAIQAEAPTE
jgi:hypothetical protein